MPVYEYECPACEKIIEIQQRMTDDPITQCPECDGPVKKLISRSSFQLKGGGWYADGYASAKAKSDTKKATSPAPSAPPCKSGGSCPAAATSSQQS